MCGEEGGGLAHGRVCKKLTNDVKWGVHHAVVRAIAGFVAGTRLCSAHVEQPMSQSVRADAVLITSQGRTRVLEVKTYVKACKSNRDKASNAVAKEKAAMARRQYEAAHSCAGLVVPFVLDTCSMRYAEEGAVLLRELQRERDELGAVIPGDEQQVVMLVAAAAAEAAGRVDTTYQAMCAGAAKRGARAAFGAAVEAVGEDELIEQVVAEAAATREAASDGGAAQQEQRSDRFGALQPVLSPVQPHPQTIRMGGRAGGGGCGVGEAQQDRTRLTPFGTPPPASPLAQSHPQRYLMGGHVGVGVGGGRHQQFHPQNKHMGGVQVQPRVLKRAGGQ